MIIERDANGVGGCNDCVLALPDARHEFGKAKLWRATSRNTPQLPPFAELCFLYGAVPHPQIR